MKIKYITAFAILAFLMACNEPSNQATNSEDSTVTLTPDNTTVSPGTPDSAKNGILDSSGTKTDSLARDKR
jgi:hypothetical protein